MFLKEQRMYKREVREFEVRIEGKKYVGIDVSVMGLSFEVPGYNHGVFFKGMPIHGRIISGDDYSYQFKGSITNVRPKTLSKNTIHQIYGVKIVWLESQRQHDKLLKGDIQPTHTKAGTPSISKESLLVEVLRSCREVQKIGLDRNTSDSEYRTQSLQKLSNLIAKAKQLVHY